MIQKNAKMLLLTSLVTLLPIGAGLLLWDRLPEVFATHWGLDGQADGFGSLPFAVFAPPLTLLAVHWLCILVTAHDPKNQDRNGKPFRLVLWIIPVISNLCCAMMYALALGVSFSPVAVMSLALGVMFAAIGNYLPKCRQNYTIGIKVPWTFASEENWNATHHFGGRVWMIGGLVMLFTAFLPGALGITVMVIAVLILSFVPILYSYLYYRKQKQRGDNLTPLPKGNPKAGKIGLAFTAATLLFVGAMLFTGKINVCFGDTAFTIEASYYDDLTVAYDSIDSLEYRESNVDGIRNWGVGSFRLLLGHFENDEFGRYTRYTYYNPEACVVLNVNGKTLVLSGKDAEATRAVYEELLSRTGN